MRRLVPVERLKRRNGASDSAVPARRVMTRALAAPDAPTLLVSLARNIPGVIYPCALDAHWTMHFIGDEIERITGYPAADFVENRHRTYMSLIHPDDRARVERDVWEAIDA